jgi:hypothetical protein
MNPFNEFIFITSAITLTFIIVIIGLIIANKKAKTEVKKSILSKYEELEKWHESSKIWQKSDLEKDNLIKDLKYKVQTKWDLGNVNSNHYRDENKSLKEAIENLELLNRQSMSNVDELTFDNEDLKKNFSRLQCEFYNETYTLNQIIDEYQLFILNNAK